MVRALANKVAYGTPSTVYADDLMGEGYVGLLEAARTYDSRFGVPFKAYAHGRVYGKMVDYLRALDPMSRRERKATTLVREAREHLQHGLGRVPSDAELADWLGQSVDYVQDATVREHRRRLLMLDEPVADGGDRVRDFVASDEDTQLERMETEEVEAAVRKAVSSLPAALRGVIEERDFNGRAVQDIAQSEGVTSSAISQRRRTALKLLRPRLTRIRRG
jgi:RNA polymerase sigma factor for flagellar operon FliA